MADTPRVWIACLAAYNEGHLHGEWVDATDVDEMNEAGARIIKTSPALLPEELAIHDYDGFGNLPSTLGEYPSFETVARIGALIEEHGDAFIAYLDAIEVDVNDEGPGERERLLGALARRVGQRESVRVRLRGELRLGWGCAGARRAGELSRLGCDRARSVPARNLRFTPGTELQRLRLRDGGVTNENPETSTLRGHSRRSLMANAPETARGIAFHIRVGAIELEVTSDAHWYVNEGPAQVIPDELQAANAAGWRSR
jgi:hypothetical protein